MKIFPSDMSLGKNEGEYFSNHIASLEEKVENDAIQKAEESSESENNSDESSDDETSKLKLLQKVGDGLILFDLCAAKTIPY
ncbi:hypothetical protein Tco_1110566 [Tanacetum coccineum]|uniref:Uncharacterized protein n=1 Tax=Tanacetum coccineum TaxID=301880 RepID=A0ABQ5IL98_9ASTR